MKIKHMTILEIAMIVGFISLFLAANVLGDSIIFPESKRSELTFPDSTTETSCSPLFTNC